MTTSRTYDGFNRLTGIASTPSGASAVSFQYAYNQANQRVAVTNADNSRVDYGYDALGQVTSGRKYWADGSPVAGQQFEYGFDTIGNRRTYKWGGDANGANLRQTSYSVNLLNQITGRNNPGYVTITGEADTNAAVKVNGTATSRHGRYFAGEAPVNNASSVWLGITNVAVAATNASSETYTKEVGHVFVPPASQILTTIHEGCLYADGRWYYRWDAENRLVKMTAASAYVGYPYQELRFTHDWQSRRISKVVSNKVSGVWYLETSRKFLYDGWNLVAELDGSNVLQRTHVWGLDASGTMQGAGGVGGLLATIIPEGLPNAGVYFPAYDGNHNVVAYISAATGAIVAEYDYGPFGELLRATGPLAKDFNFLFSTKYYDWETGLYYYGHRYYNPSIGRWLSRDPIEERGGLNLYGFVNNKALNHVDCLGLNILVFSVFSSPKTDSYWTHFADTFELTPAAFFDQYELFKKELEKALKTLSKCCKQSCVKNLGICRFLNSPENHYIIVGPHYPSATVDNPGPDGNGNVNFPIPVLGPGPYITSKVFTDNGDGSYATTYNTIPSLITHEFQHVQQKSLPDDEKLAMEFPDTPEGRKLKELWTNPSEEDAVAAENIMRMNCKGLKLPLLRSRYTNPYSK